MRAVAIREPGDVDVLEVIDRPVREARAGEVRIAVKAAAVNPTDIGLRRAGADNVPPPWTPGMDAAGTIESAGPGIDRLSVGQEVMAAPTPGGLRGVPRPSSSWCRRPRSFRCRAEPRSSRPPRCP